MASVLVTLMFVTSFVFQAFEIPSGSMENTLLIGDHLLVDRLAPSAKAGWVGSLIPYRNLARGDIAVFVAPAQPGVYLVKRIVGVPGDRIRLRDGVLYVNGQAQQEPYVKKIPPLYERYRDEFPTVSPSGYPDIARGWPAVLRKNIQGDEVVVPPGHYFGMGDNRNNSLDSRYWGFIPEENVIGRPLVIYWSFETPSDQYYHTQLSERAAFVAHVALHFFDKTRWSRMLHLVR